MSAFIKRRQNAGFQLLLGVGSLYADWAVGLEEDKKMVAPGKEPPYIKPKAYD
jgi:hypothetical protein